MVAWLQAIKSAGSIVGFIRALLLPLAYLLGRWHAHKAQFEANEKLQAEYKRIEQEALTDDDVDKRLDEGSL